jgi:hypothetical protein
MNAQNAVRAADLFYEGVFMVTIYRAILVAIA